MLEVNIPYPLIPPVLFFFFAYLIYLPIKYLAYFDFHGLRPKSIDALVHTNKTTVHKLQKERIL